MNQTILSTFTEDDLLRLGECVGITLDHFVHLQSDWFSNQPREAPEPVPATVIEEIRRLEALYEKLMGKRYCFKGES